MNKDQLVKKIAADMGGKLPEYAISEVVSKALNVISETVIAGDKVILLGFGTFTTSQIGEQVRGGFDGIDRVIPAHRRVLFRPVEAFKKALKK